MSMRLRELIRAVRACKTAAEERETVAKECAAVRTAFKDEENPYRHRNVAKLLFIHMLGYPTHFGQMECLKLIAGHSFPEKRIGYLGLMLLLDEDTEVLMLVTNSLKQDLGHTSQFVAGQALCAIGDIGSPDICRDLSGEVIKLVSSSNGYIRKKAVLCLVRTIRKCPDMIENYIDKIATLLTDRSHGVLVGALILLIEICAAMPSVIPTFRKLAPQLIRMLKNLVLSGYAPEHDVSGITDPFLQCKILHTLRLLGAGDKEVSEGMSDMLAQVATNTESTKNAGVSILYECVRTILGIEADSGLRVLGINTLGKFLLNRDNNIRYVALNTLTKVAPGDLKSIQRHRGTIVDCLRDPDISIRRRALDLVSLLVNDSNVKPLIKELLGYLGTADSEFKEDLTSKICRVVSKHAPSRRFQTNTIIQVLVDAGEHVQDDISNTLPTFIASDSLLQAHAVHTLFRALEKNQTKMSLCLAAVWCIGEYGEHLSHPSAAHEEDAALEAVPIGRVATVMSNILESSLQPVIVKIYALTAMLKLASRYPNHMSQIGSIVERHHSSIVVELQQRSSEYSMLLQLEPNFLKELVDHMPTLDDEAASGGAGGGNAAPAVSQGGASAADDLLNLLDDMTPSSSVAGMLSVGGSQTMNDLLGDVFGGQAPSMASASVVPSMGGGGGVDLLGDMLGGASLSSVPSASPAHPPSLAQSTTAAFVVNAAGNHQMLAYDKNGITAKMELVKHPVNKQLTQINASFTNSNASPVQNFNFQAAVPKHAKLQINPPSSTTIPQNNSGTVTQIFRISNPMHDQKILSMRIKLDFVLNGSPVADVVQLDGFPQGV